MHAAEDAALCKLLHHIQNVLKNAFPFGMSLLPRRMLASWWGWACFPRHNILIPRFVPFLYYKYLLVCSVCSISLFFPPMNICFSTMFSIFVHHRYGTSILHLTTTAGARGDSQECKQHSINRNQSTILRRAEVGAEKDPWPYRDVLYLAMKKM